MFTYDPCMIFKSDAWSYSKCYEASLKMHEEHNNEYEERVKKELKKYVSKKQVSRKENIVRYKKYQLPTNNERYETQFKKFNEEIKKRIQESDDFSEINIDLKFLASHQKAGCVLANKYDRFAFFYDTGTGKTIMSLAIIYEKQRRYNASFLILAPLAIIENAWLEDSYNYFPGMKIMPLCSRYKRQDYRELYEKWQDSGKIPVHFKISQYEWDYFFKASDYRETVAYMKMLGMADHYIVNIEMYRRNPDFYMMYKINGLIVDESALLKNPFTTSSNIIEQYSNEYQYIYLLSGKPAPNNSFEYYMQMRIASPDIFDMSPNDFKQAFFVSGENGLVFKNQRYESIAADMIAQKSLIVSKKDCLHLKEQYEEILSVNLGIREMAIYNKVMNGCFRQIEQKQISTSREKFLETSKKMKIITKLREVTSGFYIEEDKEVTYIHNEKDKKLVELVCKYPKEQFVIWCNFVYEIERIEKILSSYGEVVTAYGKTKNLQKNIREFKKGYVKFLVAHPKTLKYGVTLVNCQRAVYYSLSYSAEDYYQSHDRIYRMGQKKECYFYFILAKDTIDETIYKCVKDKMGYADIFQQLVKHAAEHGINYNDFSSYDKKFEQKEDIYESLKVQNKFEFHISGDTSFAYIYDNEERNSVLQNKTLAVKEYIHPEEILFEIGYDVLYGEMSNISYKHILRVSTWVEEQLRKSNISINRRIKDYLDEQEDKQYQKDIAQGMEMDFDFVEAI